MPFPHVSTSHFRLNAYARIGLCVIAFLLTGTAPLSGAEPQPAHRSPDEVVAVIPDDSPPTYFRDEKTGKAADFAVDIMDAVAKKAGIRVEYVFEHGWTNIINKVVSGEADIVPLMGVSEERKKQLAYTDELEAFPIAFFIHSHTNGSTWTAEGRRIGVITDSVAYEKLKVRTNIQLRKYDSFVNGLHDLLAEKIDAFACPAPTFLKLAREADVEDHIQMIAQPIAEIHRAIAIRKDNTVLLKRLNKAMAGFIGGKEHQRIYHAWYGKPSPYWTPGKIVAISAAIIVMIIMLMAGWRYLTVMRLNRELTASIAERKQAEIALKENEEKFRALFEGANDAVLVHVLKQDAGPGLIQEANETACKKLGYSLEELRRMSPPDFNDPRHLGHLPHTMAKLRKDGHAVFETVHVTKDRRSIPVEVSARVVNLKGIPHLISIVRDVTERKEAEAMVRKAKEEWERTFDAITDPIMILDTNYHIIKANKAMADALSVTPARAVGMTCYESVHGTEAPPDYCPHAKLLTDGQAHSQEIFEPRLGGHYFITVSPIHAPDGTLIGSIHAARDISALKMAEELSRQYSRDLERLLAISRETTMTTDLKVLYRTFVCASRELLNLDFSTLMLLSEDKKTLTMQDSLGFPESMIGRFSVVEGQGLVTLVVKSKKPEIVADFTDETRFEVPPIAREKNIRSAVAVPMMMQDNVIGVLVGHTLARRDFSRNEIDIYQHIANQAAVAIQNVMNTDILRKSEKYIRDVTASLGEGVYVLNANGETTFMNPEAEALLGWTEKELIHKNIHDVVHNRRTNGTPLLFEDCEMRKVIETGNRFHSTEELFIRKDGALLPVSVFSTPLMENGKVVASVTAFRDISERKRIEKEREILIADLQNALAEIKTLHGIVPICSSCKKIRDDEGAWHQMEEYISAHTDAQFSHGICKDCARKLYPEYYKG